STKINQPITSTTSRIMSSETDGFCTSTTTTQSDMLRAKIADLFRRTSKSSSMCGDDNETNVGGTVSDVHQVEGLRLTSADNLLESPSGHSTSTSPTDSDVKSLF